MTITQKIFGAISTLAFITLIASVASERLQSVPAIQQIDVGLEGGVPATVYFEGVDFWSDSRPGIVLAHGYAADRKTMASLAESLVHAGYTVVSIDERGHGMNRNSFRANFLQADFLASDIKAGVDFLQTTGRLEASQIVVAGHSMGASAVAAYGSHESDVGGLIMISGSAESPGPKRLKNALFVYGEKDIPGIESRVKSMASALANVKEVEQGKLYGDISRGTAVRVVEIPDTSHGQIITSQTAFSEIVNWADVTTGQPTRVDSADFVKHPLGPRLRWISFLLVLPGLGMLLARFSPTPARTEERARWFHLVLLILVLILPLAFVSDRWPGVLMSLSDADANVTHLTLGGILWMGILVLLGRIRHIPGQVPGSIAVAVVGWVTVSALLTPVSENLHGVGLTPEKAWLTLWTAICLVPFAFAFQLFMYRDRLWHGTLLRLGGRIAVLATVSIGMTFGAFGFPGIITILVLLLALVVIEPILVGFYARSNNLVTGASLDAVVTAWLFALLLPSSF